MHLGGAGNRPRILSMGCRAGRRSARDALPGLPSSVSAVVYASRDADTPETHLTLRACQRGHGTHWLRIDSRLRNQAPVLQCSA